MGDSLQKQVNAILRDKKKHRAWLAAFLCLALLVTGGTAAAFKLTGVAKTHQEKVLNCRYTVTGGEGYADYVVHVHNDDCYNAAGELVCRLPEIAPHVHTDACYKTVQSVVCGQEESDGHVHSEACYSRVKGGLTCGLEESEEHQHSDACYDWYDELTCGKQEGEGAHRHTDECYTTKRVLSCGQRELHTHDASCYDASGALICGKLELRQHVHGPECFEIRELTDEEVVDLNDPGDGQDEGDDPAAEDPAEPTDGGDEADPAGEAEDGEDGEGAEDADEAGETEDGEEADEAEDGETDEDEGPVSDPNADVETAVDWAASVSGVQLTGNWRRDVVSVARSQLGYKESSKNFELQKNGSRKGYTRYGDWYGIPYGDWCAMFVSFCLEYASVPEWAMPHDSGTTTWISQLLGRNMYVSASYYTPKAGDLIFFDFDLNGYSDHVGLVSGVSGGDDGIYKIEAIEGNHTDTVETFIYYSSNPCIAGYGQMPTNPNGPADEPEQSSGLVILFEEDVKPAQNFDGETATMKVTVEAPEGAFPMGTRMVVRDVQSAPIMDALNGAVDRSIAKAYAVDITFYDAAGKEIEPELPIRVTMRPLSVTISDPVIVHVGDDGEAQVVEQSGSTGGKVAFESDRFSTYVIVEMEPIEAEYLSADGNTYQITVDIPENAGIPEGSELVIHELTPIESRSYREKAAMAIGADLSEISYARLLDISITYGGAELQPQKPVEVTVRLLDKPDSGSTKVVHFGRKTEVLDATAKGDAVSFEAEGFSIYAIIEKDEPDSVARANIIFQHANGDPYTFLNNAGMELDNQVIHTGSYLEDVGMPPIDVSDQTFQGWFIYDVENDTWTGYKLNFGESNTWTVGYGDTKSITSSTATVTTEDADADGAIFYARPYFGEVSYITFYNECDGGVILNRVQVIKGTTYDISTQQAVPPDAILNEETGEWEPVSFVFAGWSDQPGENNDDRAAITNTVVTVNGDMTYYPVFKQGHWVSFHSAPTGSGATYIPAKIVLSTQTTAVARPTVTPVWKGHTFVGWFTEDEAFDKDNADYYNEDGTINTDYNGYLSTGETSDGAYAFNEYLDEDLTLYAHWNAGTANVTVVKWQQVVTDKKDAVTPSEEQMQAAGYASDTTLKHYEYAGQQNLTETVNSILYNNDGDIVIPTGFELNGTLSQSSVVVKDDGTAVLNLYFDRQMTYMVFSGYGNEQGTYYTETDSNNGTQYGYVNGQYVRLTRGNAITTSEAYYTYNYFGQNVEYTGTFYTRSGGGYNATQYNGDNLPPAGDNTRYYTQNMGFGVRYELTRRTRTNTTYPWTYVDANGETQTYTGTRYVQTTANNTTVYSGLYGQTLEQNGYSWPNRLWFYNQDDGSQMGMSYLGQFVLPEGVSGNTIVFTSEGSAGKTFYFFLQNVDGTYNATYSDIGYGSSNVGTFYFSEKYDGFTVDSYQRGNEGNGTTGTWTTTANGQTVSMSGYNSLGIRYRRINYNIKFLDSNDGSVLPDVDPVQVAYGASMSGAEPDITELSNSNTQYVWDGKWYADQACTTEFNFNDVMPNHDVAVYAGWKEVWYWIKLEPNGGVLTSTEATWFWESYGELVEEYHDVTRFFVEDPDGEYYYHYDELDPETELNQYGTNERKAYYTTDPSLSSDGGKTYSPDQNTYSLVGWYKVNDDGTLEPYNFSSPVTGNLTLRALWRVVGQYQVKYSMDGVDLDGEPIYFKDENGEPTENRVQATTTPPVDGNKYADKSSSSILSPVTPPSGYTFAGWYYNGHVYNPGDSFIVDADLADDNKDVWLYPVFLTIEDQPVEVTHIRFLGNGGTTELTSDDTATPPYEVSDASTTVTMNDIQPNTLVDIAATAEYFTRTGYTFIGWGKRTEGSTTTANNFLEYRDGKFYTKSGAEVMGIAADEIAPYEELYALWEVKNYTVTVEKVVVSPFTEDQHLPFTFVPSFTGLTGAEYQQNFSLTGQETTITSTTDEGEVTATYETTKTYAEVPYGTTFSFAESDPDFTTTEAAVRVKDADGEDDGSTVTKTDGLYTVTGDMKVTFTNTRKTFAVDFVKKDKEDKTGDPLSGATFTLNRFDGMNYAAYGTLTIGTATQELIAGSYELVETSAPDGYVIAQNRIYFTVASDGTVTLANGTDADLAELLAGTSTGSKGTVAIYNTPGVALPMTGGAGTMNYTSAGLALILSSALMYGARTILRRRKEGDAAL